MADVSNEFNFEVMKGIQPQLSNMEIKLGEMDGRLTSISLHSLAVQTDVKNIYSTLGQIEHRIDRIEKRLDLVSEPAE